MDQGRGHGYVYPGVVEQLRLSDQLTDPVADHVHAEDLSLGSLDHFDCPRGLQDLALAVAGQVVGHGGDGLTVLPARGSLELHGPSLEIGDTEIRAILSDFKPEAGAEKVELLHDASVNDL